LKPTEGKNKIFRSILCQQIYVLDLLRRNGWSQRDAPLHNWMFKKTSAKHIMCDKITVPLHGYQIYLIDYGLISHVDFPTTDDKEIQRRKEPLDDLAIMMFDWIYHPMIEIMKKGIMWPKTNVIVERLVEQPGYSNIKKYIPMVGERTTMTCIMTMMLLFYPAQFFRAVGISKDYDKVISSYSYSNDEKKLHVYFMEHIEHPMEIVKYLVD